MKLDLNTLNHGILKNIRNAQELVDEAEILFKNEKYARTYFLSHLAIEESSKCAMLLKVIAFNIWGEEIEIKNVKKRSLSHLEKIKNFELMNMLTNKINFNDIDFDKSIKFLNNSKNDSLYVSWSNENIFTLPSEIFSMKEAEEKLLHALNYVKRFTSISIKLINNCEEVYKWIAESKNYKIVAEIIKIEKERKHK